jgi:hypothetical protein
MALVSTQPLAGIGTRNLPGGKGRPALKADHHLLADCLENVGASIPHNPIGLHGLLQGYLLHLREKNNNSERIKINKRKGKKKRNNSNEDTVPEIYKTEENNNVIKKR